MANCFVTIIIPTFNAGVHLPGALESIRDQQFIDLEVLIMDGLSTDHTVTIAREASAVDSRIRVFSQKDAGIYDAMNKGIKLANGEWLYFLGADDRLKGPEVLKVIYEKAKLSSADLIYGDAIVNDRVYDGPFNYEKLLTKNICHQAIFFRRSVFDICGNYEVSFKLHADWDLNLRIFRNMDIQTEYIRLDIANFGVGGVSALHDVPFLRNSLMPAKLDQLKKSKDRWSRITSYDQWWRLVRNANIRSVDMLREVAAGRELPGPLIRLVARQGRLSARLLKKGVYSKTFMLFSFIREISTRKQ